MGVESALSTTTICGSAQSTIKEKSLTAPPRKTLNWGLPSHQSALSQTHLKNKSKERQTSTMDPEPTDPNLLLLALNLSDSDPDEAAAPQTTTSNTSTGPTTEYQPTRADRSALSEEAFLALKQSYRPKIENGNVRHLHSPSPSVLTPPHLVPPHLSSSTPFPPPAYLFLCIQTSP